MRILLVLALSLFGLAAAGAGSAGADVTVTHPWARATPGASTTGAAYLTVTASGTADRLLGVSTPAAGMAELHQSANDNGVMTMRPVAALALEPGKPVTLAPGGYHVMLMDLRQPLKPGDHFPLTLTFEHASPVTVLVEVGQAGARSQPGNDAGHGTGREDAPGHQH
jgi:copper(I)-binding protein